MKLNRKYRIQKMRRRIFLIHLKIMCLSVIMIITVTSILKRFDLLPDFMHNPLIRAVTVCNIILGFFSFLSYFITSRIFEPLEQISRASKKVANGDYSVQINYKQNIDEFRITIDNFNKMVREIGSVEMIRNDFITNVSHEFKTPLSSITGYVTLLQENDLSEEEKNEYIQKTFFNIEKLNNLTDNILKISRIENQNNLPEPVQYRLDEQIREAIVLLEPKWSKKNINFDIELQDIVYTGQQALLFQVWINIIGNAIKFSDNGGEISVCLNQDPNLLKVTISDNGIGMTEETKSHIFDKFYQGDTSRRLNGNGLGLALCREIIDRCSGKIYVASQPECGSVFTVVLFI